MKYKAIKVLALLLGIGGALGMAMSIYSAVKSLGLHWVLIVPEGALFFLFYWSSLTGLRLWKNDAKGWKWAKYLFAAQIPILTVPGLAYQYSTGLYFNVIGGHTEHHFFFGIGANANMFLDTSITNWMYGINLFAVFAFVFLLRASKSVRLASAAASMNSSNVPP